MNNSTLLNELIRVIQNHSQNDNPLPESGAELPCAQCSPRVTVEAEMTSDARNESNRVTRRGEQVQDNVMTRENGVNGWQNRRTESEQHEAHRNNYYENLHFKSWLDSSFSKADKQEGRDQLENTTYEDKCKTFKRLLTRFPFYFRGYRHLQGMRYAIEEINNSSSLLPNITLGYEAFDDCFEPAGVMAIFDFLASHSQPFVKVLSNYSAYKPRVIAVIGPTVSDTAVVTASILSNFLVPQVSYSAASEVLSNKRVFPSFLRTFLSDQKQAQAMILLLKTFHWNWVIVIGSNSEYGRRGKQQLVTLASAYGICVAYDKTLNQGSSTFKSDIADIIYVISKQNVNVILLFAEDLFAAAFFKEVIPSNVTSKVWIASSVWAIDRRVTEIPNIWKIGTVLGIAPQHGDMPGLKQFLSKFVGQKPSEYNASFSASEEWYDVSGNCNHICEECSSLTPEAVLDSPEIRAVFRTYSAVYAMAYALHNLLDCDTDLCKETNIFPWQLLEKIKQVNFTLHGKQIYFDQNGDAPTGYDIIMWNWTNSRASFDTVGTYTSIPGRIDVNTALITWYTGDKMVPKSVCSEECLPGQKRKQAGPHFCCFFCLTCPEGTYLNSTDPYECLPCLKDMWSPEGSQVCFPRTLEYLEWNNEISVLLMILSATGLFLTGLTMLVFLRNLDTPVVKAAGGKACLLMLTFIIFCYCSVFSFIGKPNETACVVRQLMFPISFTAFMSCLVLRSFLIVCIFKMASSLPKSFDYWVKQHGQSLFLAVGTATQMTISSFWLTKGTFKPALDYTFKEAIILKCGTNQSLALLTQDAFTGFLSIICFVFSYMGKDLPKNYSEAKCITVTILVYFFSLASYFLFNVAQNERYSTILLAAIILVRLYGILGGYFFPKFYIIAVRPQKNTTAYFQSCIQNYTNSSLTN
ncbi:taste receptor type 1 member 1-like [Protopterus annectens]|uniref:taste receptor type 1 member 1-like n=1 Tax=Protopterus annectens TaxID=7888 RepID=UPI001CFC15C3|nr:taste receptor type 1 member 1-like [Protopterus annectens]